MSRSVLRVDLSRIEANTRAIVRRLGYAKLWVVVKGDGYGIGLKHMATAASAGGCYGFVCAGLSEAEELRAARFTHPILCSTVIEQGTLERLSILQIDLALGSWSQLKRICEFSSPIRVQIEVDTGIGRGGFRPEELLRVVEQLKCWPHVIITGIWSHLAQASDDDVSARQLHEFLSACAVTNIGVPRHLIATGGLRLGSDYYLEGARIGLGCLGLVGSTLRESLGIKLALDWSSRLQLVYDRAEGALVGYGGKVRLQRPSRLGLIPVGIADGYPRLKKGVVAVGGTLAPILGAVGMTSMLVDLTEVHLAAEGDLVVLLSEKSPDIGCLRMVSQPEVIPNSFVCCRTNSVTVSTVPLAG